MHGNCSHHVNDPQDKPSDQPIRCGCSKEETCDCSRRSSSGHFQLNNADVGSERVDGHLLSLLTSSSSSFQRSNQAPNKSECTSSMENNHDSSRRLVVRRNLQPISGATIRTLTSCIANVPNLINSGTFTTLLFGSTPLRQFSLAQGLFGVPSSLFQSIVQHPHTSRDSTTLQLEEAPPSFDDSGFPNENQLIDIWRQLLAESTLYIHRPAENNMLEGSSSSVFRVTADSGSVNFRLVTDQNTEVVNQSLLYFSIEMRNRFGGMRLDVDNMSYEELLALEDHIGYVSTGLSEEAAVASLRRSNYFLLADENAQKEFCSICQEDFIDEDELGTLDCGHSFHICCIKQWLGYKNVCPICKSPGLPTTDSHQ